MKKQEINNIQIKKILIIRLDHIGDLMLTAPMVASLRKGFAGAKITMLIGDWNREVLDKTDLVDEVIIYNSFWNKRVKVKFWNTIITLIRLRKLKFDMVINLRGELQERLFAYFIGAPLRIGFDFGLGKIVINHLVKSNMDKHIIDRYLDISKYLNCPVVNKELLRINFSEEDINYAKKICKLSDCLDETLRIVIAPGAGYATKLWDTNKFSNLAKYFTNIMNSGLRVIIVGDNKDHKLSKEMVFLSGPNDSIINLVGKTSIKQLAAVISLSSLVICLDSAPMHIAASLNVPLVALFGPTRVCQWGPHSSYDSSIVISKNLDCCGCVKPKCSVNKCMQLISEQDVIDAANKLIEKYFLNAPKKKVDIIEDSNVK